MDCCFRLSFSMFGLLQVIHVPLTLWGSNDHSPPLFSLLIILDLLIMLEHTWGGGGGASEMDFLPGPSGGVTYLTGH